jgi:hypothetical protein
MSLTRLLAVSEKTYESLESQSRFQPGRGLCVTFCGVSAGVPPSGVVTFLFTDIEGSTRR